MALKWLQEHKHSVPAANNSEPQKKKKKSRQRSSKPMNDGFQLSPLASLGARRFTPKARRKRRERAGARRVHPWRAADLSSLGCLHSSGALCHTVTTRSHHSPDPMTQRSGSDSHLPGGWWGGCISPRYVPPHVPQPVPMAHVSRVLRAAGWPRGHIPGDTPSEGARRGGRL